MNRFMFGRYGMDELNRFLLYASLGCVIINLFVGSRIISALVVAMFIFIYARCFSRAIQKRQAENLKYLEIKNKILGGRSRGGYKAASDGKRVLICPYCREKLRVPVGAGKIKIRCPHCNKEFEEFV